MIINWKSRDFIYKEKTKDWYWVLWSVSFFVIFLLYYFLKDIVAIILVFMLTFLINLASFKKPKVKEYKFEKDGLYEEEAQILLLSEVKSYNIDYPNLKIIFQKKNKNIVKIPFEENQNISIMDKFLAKNFKKDESLKVSFFEVFLKRLIGL